MWWVLLYWSSLNTQIFISRPMMYSNSSHHSCHWNFYKLSKKKSICSGRRWRSLRRITGKSFDQGLYPDAQEAVPSSFGLLFSAYNEALSRDWWRVSKCSERIKQVNLGGGAIGTRAVSSTFFFYNGSCIWTFVILPGFLSHTVKIFLMLHLIWTSGLRFMQL